MNAPVLTNILKAGATFETVDIQLAEVLSRRSGSAGASANAIMIVVAILSRALREGHSALAYAEVLQQFRDSTRSVGTAGSSDTPGTSGDLAVPTTTGELEVLLHRSPVVGGAAGTTPLVAHNGILQFRRYYNAEHRIAKRVRQLLQLDSVAGIEGFSIVTGGPGTGKTTHVARQLVELRAGAPTWRIALAAPTGKAAARLNESMRERLKELGSGDHRGPAHDTAARTLHRLLAYAPSTHTFRRNASDPLAEDLVIVDEASMMDVLVLDALLCALKPGARLMLVGDLNQLASVDAGDILSAFCEAEGNASMSAPHDMFAGAVTRLTHSYRFDRERGIGELADAVLAGRINDVVSAARPENSDEVRLIAPGAVALQLPEVVTAWLDVCLQARTPDDLLDAMDKCRILAPEREGRMGVHAINAAVERWLHGRGVAVRDEWYHMRPILIEANDYTVGVFNGDLGVVWREGSESAVYFRNSDGGVRAVASVRLPAAQTAWAMTVHKSQGSEFEEVVVIVPEHDSRVLSRQLLYTAVTRARRRVTLVASAESLESALSRASRRSSGLGWALSSANGF